MTLSSSVDIAGGIPLLRASTATPAELLAHR